MEDALVGGAEEEPEEPEELPLEEDEEVYMDKFQVWKKGRYMCETRLTSKQSRIISYRSETILANVSFIGCSTISLIQLVEAVDNAVQQMKQGGKRGKKRQRHSTQRVAMVPCRSCADAAEGTITAGASVFGL
jgi:hypothetical protein